MKNVLVALALAAALLPAAAFAQSDTEVAAREFLEASEAKENFERGFELGLQEGGAELSPEAMRVVREVMREHFSWPEMEREFVALYARLFTAEELRSLSAFYRTPVGQKMTEVTPEIALATQRIANERLQALMPVLMQRLMEVMEP